MKKAKGKSSKQQTENGTILEVSKIVRIEKNLHSLLKILRCNMKEPSQGKQRWLAHFVLCQKAAFLLKAIL